MGQCQFDVIVTSSVFRQPRISSLIIYDMERWVCIETADRKQPAWCEHGEYRRYVFGPVNVKRKRARLDLTSHQTYRST